MNLLKQIKKGQQHKLLINEKKNLFEINKVVCVGDQEKF